MLHLPKAIFRAVAPAQAAAGAELRGDLAREVQVGHCEGNLSGSIRHSICSIFCSICLTFVRHLCDICATFVRHL